MSVGKLFLVALVLVGATGRIASADCTPQWLTGPGQALPAPKGTVYAMTTWDPDGPGSDPEQLAVASYYMGLTLTGWNGAGWQAVGPDVLNWVGSLAVYNGELVAGGYFFSIYYDHDHYVEMDCIARWNGTKWLPLGEGMNSFVYALAVYNGELIAGGDFWAIGDEGYSQIARWNGSAWQPLGDGVSGGSSFFASVAALTVYNGELIAGGRFTTAGGVECNHIARWNGSAWQPLGTGVSGGTTPCVTALTVHNGELIVGGSFTAAGGVPCNNIARWNGTDWQAMATGTDGSVLSLTVHNGDLLAGGSFTTADGVTLNGIARWDGSAWQPVGGGMW